MPLTYYFGHPSPKDNVELYNSFIEILATQVKARLDSDVDTKASGIIVNTFGWVDGGGMDVIHHCIKCFNIDVVLVMNHDKLFATLSGLSNQGITVVKLPTSGGIVRRVNLSFLQSSTTAK